MEFDDKINEIEVKVEQAIQGGSIKHSVTQTQEKEKITKTQSAKTPALGKIASFEDSMQNTKTYFKYSKAATDGQAD